MYIPSALRASTSGRKIPRRRRASDLAMVILGSNVGVSRRSGVNPHVFPNFTTVDQPLSAIPPQIMDVEMQECSSPLGDFWDSIAQKRFESIEDQHPPVCWEYQKFMIRAFDEDIVAIGRMLRLFSRRRNAHLPINQLPVEVLGRIFYFVPPEKIPQEQLSNLPMPRSALEWRRPEDRTLLPRIKSISKLTHVCSRWRSVAFAHSDLWASIDLARLSDHYISTALSRSAGCALDITALKYGQSNLSERLFGVHDWPRIRSLDIEAVPFQLARILPSNNLISSLKDLSAQNMHGNVDAFAELFSPNCPIVLPSGLTSLALCDYQISWIHFPRLAQLTNLELRGHPGLASEGILAQHFNVHLEYPSLDVMVEILCHLPHLQHLSLAAIFPHDQNSATLPALTTAHTIPLLHLANLQLSGEGDAYAFLFSVIDMPPTISLIIDIAPYSTNALDSMLAKCHPIAQNRPMLSYFDNQSNHGVGNTTFTLWTQHEMNCNAGPSVSIRLVGDLSTPEILIDRLRANLPLNDITHLVVGSHVITEQRASQRQSIYDIFRDTASVINLKVYEAAFDDAVSALMDTCPADSSVGSGSGFQSMKTWRCLPKLRCLGLQSMPFGVPFTTLCEGLRRRHDFGTPVQELVFKFKYGRRTFEEDGAALQRYVVKPIVVDWEWYCEEISGYE